MCAANNIIVEAEDDKVNFTEPAKMTAASYHQMIWKQEFKCGRVYDEPELANTFSEELQKLICY